MFHHPKCFRTFLIEEIFIYFRVFCYDLEISESLENATPNATIRLQNVALKKYVDFFTISSDSTKSQQLVQESSVLHDGSPPNMMEASGLTPRSPQIPSKGADSPEQNLQHGQATERTIPFSLPVPLPKAKRRLP